MNGYPKQFIDSVLKSRRNGYPKQFIDSVLKSRSSSRLEKEEKPLGSVFIPYVKGISEKFKLSSVNSHGSWSVNWAKIVGVSVGSVKTIILDELNISKVSTCWVQKLLSCEQKER
jgi:hypothetical protein